MAQLTITIPDDVVPRVMEALRARHYWTTEGKNDAQAGRAVIAYLLRQEVVAYERNKVEQETRDLIDQAAETAETAMGVVA